MKPNNKILLYDDYCPLCTWYSGLFVRCGLLEAGNRVPFSKADLAVLTTIDIEKGKDEIPLYDPATNQTLYGIDALLEIIGQRIPLVQHAGNIEPIKWVFKKTYKLISYNRKVIVARKCGPGTFDCSPGFNPFYRIIFMSLFLLFNSFMLFPLHHYLLSQLSFYHLSDSQLHAGHIVFVAINCLLASFLSRRLAIEYLGQINMLALVCILLLTSVMLITFILPVSEWLILLFISLITVFIIKEYARRMKYAGILTRYKAIVWVNIVCIVTFLAYVFQ